MTTGPHVFGDNRVGLWVASSSNLTDKLKHFLPRLRGAIPNLTDLFLPPEATVAQRKQCIDAGFFAHMYMPPPGGRNALEYANDAVAAHAKQKAGALELNIEGVPDRELGLFVEVAVARIRVTKPNLPLRINVVPFKGQFLPGAIFDNDPQLYAIAQTYGGNMEHLYAADEVLKDLRWSILEGKCSVMHPVMCAYRPGRPRQVTLPQIRNRGSLYIDDLLLDAGLL